MGKPDVPANTVPMWKLSIWQRDHLEAAMLRAPMLIILFIALWGVNVFIFEKLRFQYHHVLSTKPQSVATPIYTAILLGFIYSVLIISLVIGFSFSIEMSLLSYYLLMFIMVMVPHLPGQDVRSSLFRLLYQVFFPMNSVSFAEVVLADVLTSLSKVFKDIGFTIIIIYAKLTNSNIIDHHDSGMILIAVLASLPFWLRIRQCSVQLWHAPDFNARIPISLNTLKYVSGFPPIWIAAVASLGYFHPKLPLLTAVFATINSLFSYSWDLLMDWGMISFFRGKNAIHRTPRRLIHVGFLFIASLVNLILRFSWTANYFPLFASLHPASLIFIVEVAEVFRRWFWIIFRVEWEILAQTERGLLKDKDEDHSSVSASLIRSASQ